MKSLYLYLKNYWYVPLIAVTVVFCFFFHRSAVDRLLKLISQASSNHRKDLEQMSGITESTVNKALKSSQKYVKTIEEINEQESAALEKARQREEESIKNKDTDFLAEEMKRVFGE